jgi:hypothetical protein
VETTPPVGAPAPDQPGEPPAPDALTRAIGRVGWKLPVVLVLFVLSIVASASEDRVPDLLSLVVVLGAVAWLVGLVRPDVATRAPKLLGGRIPVLITLGAGLIATAMNLVPGDGEFWVNIPTFVLLVRWARRDGLLPEVAPGLLWRGGWGRRLLTVGAILLGLAIGTEWYGGAVISGYQDIGDYTYYTTHTFDGVGLYGSPAAILLGLVVAGVILYAAWATRLPHTLLRWVPFLAVPTFLYALVQYLEDANDAAEAYGHFMAGGPFLAMVACVVIVVGALLLLRRPAAAAAPPPPSATAPPATPTPPPPAPPPPPPPPTA